MCTFARNLQQRYNLMKLQFFIPLTLASFFSFFVSLAQDSLSLKREFRGVWVATVANIDWPSRQGLSTQQQKNELIKILNTHQKQGINAIMFQVRPAADAFYPNCDEPWSQYLTGTQGQCPMPFYDPLHFAIAECHKRNIEFHAWFNPYRATFDGNDAKITANHITKLKPDWFFIYEGKKLFNPGLPDVRAYILKIILNVVDSYDIDGVHFDDYFYPYIIKGQTLKDTETFILYNNGIADIKNWRRQNVDTLIHSLNDSIHAHKNYVKFGVSPFGIWKNKAQDPEGSDTRGGDSYYEIYADSRKWIKNGWVDYLNPQLYWSFTTKAAPFANLANWWGNNTYGRNMYIGHGAYRINTTKDASWRNPAQLGKQIAYIRQNENIHGSVFFSSKSLTKNPLGISDTLSNNYYKFPALPPLMPWLDSIPPYAPNNLQATFTPKGTLLTWLPPPIAADKQATYGYVVYRFASDEVVDLEYNENIKVIFYSPTLSWLDISANPKEKYKYVVTALDRLKNESKASNIVFF